MVVTWSTDDHALKILSFSEYIFLLNVITIRQRVLLHWLLERGLGLGISSHQLVSFGGICCFFMGVCIWIDGLMWSMWLMWLMRLTELIGLTIEIQSTQNRSQFDGRGPYHPAEG